MTNEDFIKMKSIAEGLPSGCTLSVPIILNLLGKEYCDDSDSKDENDSYESALSKLKDMGILDKSGDTYYYNGKQTQYIKWSIR